MLISYIISYAKVLSSIHNKKSFFIYFLSLVIGKYFQ
nr:MAG TPA: hypothetical protein [Caudoviricetes sp.]